MCTLLLQSSFCIISLYLILAQDLGTVTDHATDGASGPFLRARLLCHLQCADNECWLFFSVFSIVTSVIFVLTYFLVLVAVFELFFSFSFVLVFIIFSF